MKFRTAQCSDIQQMQKVRHLVKENTLSDPDLVTDEDVKHYIFEKGKGFICELDGQIVGFSIVDLAGRSVWALFVDPQFEGIGIGKVLHQRMLDWYFTQTKDNIVLGTAPDTRAERFYSLQGWIPAGKYPNGEIKFELTFYNWNQRNN